MSAKLAKKRTETNRPLPESRQRPVRCVYGKADFRLFDDVHFVDKVLATAEFLDDEQDVADIYGDTTLQVVVEVDVAAQ